MTKMKLQTVIEQQVATGGKAFIPYIMAGDGGLQNLREQLLFLQESGATAVELGIPFSDPVADGPTIQEAGKRALTSGVTLRGVLEEIGRIRHEITIPIVLMTYLNPVFRYGIEKIAQDCAEAGVSGLIVPDLPLEESAMVKDEFSKHDLALVQLVSLTSPQERIERIAKASEGFLYAVTVTGITGARAEFAANVGEHLAKLKKVSLVPVMAGFGISTPEQVREMGKLADGVIVGSSIVDALHDGNLDCIRELIAASKAVEIG
ncbi:tryptophan synthase subunit alpha [Paenisporosarcina quisquiliarum]|uniref:Tryptophan synthase alpha chain n=1 Tax=Paenisporosarcina quisquiliarum TaxID=365346 RepID=A0A9X3RDP0_9BACL|nr:tryptophan synthase subunit alpha [Paenisporosarcina quisquiliarum]MCZ8537751.1 tryptophan synthase subunit alpha [Paenisporosarcina quisquiliarum]